jgi:nucleoside-diphosphate-sugar epimerase
MRTLVTGATGMVGSHMVERFMEHGHDVRALARASSDISHLKTTGAEIVYGDVEDVESLRAAVRDIDVVMHAAARVMPGWGTWEDYERCIVSGTANLLHASAEAGVSRFLQVSTASMYGEACCRGVPAKESTSCEVAFKPENYYDCAKLEAEKVAFEFHRSGKLQVTAIRPGWVYGPRDRLLADRLFKQLRMPIVAWPGKANPRIPVVYATDVADCTILAVTSDRAAGQAYNVAPLHEIRLRDFANVMARELGRPEPRIFIPFSVAYAVCALSEAWSRLRRVKEMPFLTRSGLRSLNSEMLVDASKAREELGWEPKVPVEDGVRLYVEWLRSQGRL